MDLVCFSHLRWNFVYQRPQHLLTRFANYYRVFYVEEYIYSDGEDGYSLSVNSDNVNVIIPHLKSGDIENVDINERIANIICQLFKAEQIEDYLFWYYTPMAVLYSRRFNPSLIVYDCMDELSAFSFAPASLKDAEQELFLKADVVFTGGVSLYNAKKAKHPKVFCFPSSIDKEHFSKARNNHNQPDDQMSIPHPRFGFFGVIDERFDIDLIRDVSAIKPDWHFIILGPVVKIDPATLPVKENIHYLGSKNYEELPLYISGWDVAMIPFAINASTKFISPTKTPEYLAAGVPVISTAIQDVVDPYGLNKTVNIISSAKEFVDKATAVLHEPSRAEWLSKVDVFLKNNSWNNTWQEMNEIIDEELFAAKANLTDKTKQYV